MKRLALFALLASGTACVKTIPVPLAVPEFATADNETNHGHETYIAHCNQCHGYPAPDAVGEQKWPGVIDKMGKKAKISDADAQAVLKYIMALRESGI